MLCFLTKKPIFSISLICLLLFLTAGIFFNCSLFSVSTIHFLIISTILIFCVDTFLQKIELTLCSLIFLALQLISNSESGIFLLIGEIFTLISVYYFSPKQSQKHAFFIFTLSFLFHLYYIQNTSIDIRQHDTTGVIYYMMQITKNVINFYEFDPWHMYYFFHQPLHFILQGYLYFLEIFIWNSTNLAQEGLQYLSLFYVSIIILLAYKILRKLELDDPVVYALFILFSFNPTLFLFSGYITDDTPVLFWTILFIYQILQWYQNNKTLYIIYAALAFSCGVLTKLSILTLVPAVGLLFLFYFIQSNDKKNIFFQICLFVSIAVPLSLVWIIRNHVLFDMQFYNIPDTSPSGQNFYYLTFIDRIFDFSNITNPFINAPYSSDSNMWLALIKTELFGEWDFSLKSPIVYYPAVLLYIFNIVLKIICFVFCLQLILFNIKKKLNPLVLFFVIVYLTIWIYSFKYAMDYPYVCSSDYRLFAHLMLPEIIILGVSIKKYIPIWLKGSFIYAALSSFIYLNL